MHWRYRLVRALNSACTVVDDVAYRPAVVRLTLRLPRWWHCELADLSMRLDDRWETGYWSGELAPAAPEGVCDVCHRRAAWLVVGGPDEDDPDAEYPDDHYLFEHPLHICSWCHVDLGPIRSAADLERAVARARSRSIAWRWRWRPV